MGIGKSRDTSPTGLPGLFRIQAAADGSTTEAASRMARRRHVAALVYRAHPVIAHVDGGRTERAPRRRRRWRRTYNPCNAHDVFVEQAYRAHDRTIHCVATMAAHDNSHTASVIQHIGRLVLLLASVVISHHNICHTARRESKYYAFLSPNPGRSDHERGGFSSIFVQEPYSLNLNNIIIIIIFQI